MIDVLGVHLRRNSEFFKILRSVRRPLPILRRSLNLCDDVRLRQGCLVKMSKKAQDGEQSGVGEDVAFGIGGHAAQSTPALTGAAR